MKHTTKGPQNCLQADPSGPCSPSWISAPLPRFRKGANAQNYLSLYNESLHHKYLITLFIQFLYPFYFARGKKKKKPIQNVFH